MIGPDDMAVTALRHARDWLRGFRDAGFWCAAGPGGEFTLPHALPGEEAAPCGHPGRDGYCDQPGCWSCRKP